MDYFVSQTVYWFKWLMWNFMLYAQYFVPILLLVSMLLWLRRERSFVVWLGLLGACWFAGSVLLAHSRINMNDMPSLRIFLQDGYWSGLALLSIALVVHFKRGR